MTKAGNHFCSSRDKRLVLVAAILASSMGFIDGSALNVALPRIQQELNLSTQALLWVINIYLLFIASFMLTGGGLGDRFGKRKIFIIGIIGFMLSSALCGLSNDAYSLISMRGLQGIAGAMMVPGSLAVLSVYYPPSERGAAIGTWGTFSALTTVAGPVLGGWLTSMGLWRGIFYINIPLGIIALLLLSMVKNKAMQNNSGISPDWKGSMLISLGLGGIAYGLVDASRAEPDVFWMVFSLCAGTILTILFWQHEKKAPNAMMPPSLFKVSGFTGANLLTLFLYAALGIMLFFIPINLVNVQGYTEAETGYSLLPFILMIGLLSRASGKLADKLGSRPFLIAGPLITGIGFLWFGCIGLTNGPSDYWSSFLPGFIITGGGMGITIAPLTTTVMNCVDDSQTGIASGVNNTVSRIAHVIAIALLGALALIVFRKTLLSVYQGYPAEILAFIKANSSKMTTMEVPKSFSNGLKNEFQHALNLSFILSFNVIAWCCAGLSISSAIVASVFIKKDCLSAVSPNSG